MDIYSAIVRSKGMYGVATAFLLTGEFDKLDVELNEYLDTKRNHFNKLSHIYSPIYSLLNTK